MIASSEDDDDREFARFLKVSDIDQDGRSDLLVGHWYDAPVDRQGSMKIFLGRDFNTTPEISSADQFDWRIQGESDFDYLGISGDVMDVNADGLPDVLIGASQGGERSIGTSNHRVGHVGVYLGQPNDVPEGAPHTQSHGEISGDWWGHGVTAFTRPHPQGTVTGLVVFSSRKDKNEAAKLPHLALTELVAPTADPIDAGPPQPSTCEVVAQIETSVVYPTEQPTLAVQVSVSVFETTDAGNGGFVLILGRLSIFGPSRKSVLHPPGNQESPTRRPHGSMPFSRTKPMALGSLRVTFPPRALAKKSWSRVRWGPPALGFIATAMPRMRFFRWTNHPDKTFASNSTFPPSTADHNWPIRSLRP